MGIQVYTNRTLRERDKRINEGLQQEIAALKADAANQEEALAAKDLFIVALKADKTRLEEKIAMLSAEKERLNKTWKMNYDLLIERVGKADKMIEELKEECNQFGRVAYETVIFLRAVMKGSNIRTDKPGGKALVERAKTLLQQYGEPDDSQVIDK